jgi:hypothetical protein
MNFKTILFFVCSISLFSSCSRENSLEDDINPLVVNSKFNAIVEDVSQIIIEQYYQQQANLTDLPGCTSLSTTTDGITWTRTITYNNYTLPNGNVLNGDIIITSNNLWDIATKIVYTFNGFTHNGIQVTTEETVVEKTFETTASQLDIHPVFKMFFRMNLILPDSLE